jgi:hypothetical protein
LDGRDVKYVSLGKNKLSRCETDASVPVMEAERELPPLPTPENWFDGSKCNANLT